MLHTKIQGFLALFTKLSVHRKQITFTLYSYFHTSISLETFIKLFSKESRRDYRRQLQRYSPHEFEILTRPPFLLQSKFALRDVQNNCRQVAVLFHLQVAEKLKEINSRSLKVLTRWSGACYNFHFASCCLFLQSFQFVRAMLEYRKLRSAVRHQ